MLEWQDSARFAEAVQGRLGYRSQRVGELVLSAYGSGLRRGGDFAHWAQLTNQPQGSDGRDVGTIIALRQLRLNLDGLLHASDELDFALASTYFEGGILPQDRIELGSELFYGERNQSYRGVDSAVEARWTPSDRFNAIVGIESLHDHEKLPAPSRVLRATGAVVRLGDEDESERDFLLSNVGAFLSVNAKVYDPWLKLTGGVRYDRHSEYGDQLTGRLGATEADAK